ncbi:zinc metalloprotease [Nocardioides pakistanensis]
MRRSRPLAPQRLAAAVATLSLLTVPALAVESPARVGTETAGSVAGSVAGIQAQQSARVTGRRAITATWGATAVERGQRGVEVRGAVAGGGQRRVVLQVRAGSRWRVVRARTTTRAGAYRFVLPTGRVGTFVYRVVSPVTPRQRRAGLTVAVSDRRRLRVVPAGEPLPEAPADPTADPTPEPAPEPTPEPTPDLQRPTTPALGNPADFSYMIAKRARWNPCRVINYRVNTTYGPPSALQDTIGAMNRIEQATGLDLEYVGKTDLIPQDQQGTYPFGTQIVIAWASRAQSAMITGDSVAGVGGPMGYGGTIDEDGVPVVTWSEGTVVLNSAFNDVLDPGFGVGATVGKLLMHEVGHVIGLGHAGGEEQVMYPTLLRGTPSAWGAGDLSGLRSQGAEHGCIYRPDGSLARIGRFGVFSQVTADTLADLEH